MASAFSAMGCAVAVQNRIAHLIASSLQLWNARLAFSVYFPSVLCRRY